jgi:hypothetical protein
VSEAQQNQALVQVFLKVRMQGKDVVAVGEELEEVMKYATGLKLPHELNSQLLPAASGDCPNGSYTLPTRKVGQVMCGSNTYDR